MTVQLVMVFVYLTINYKQIHDFVNGNTNNLETKTKSSISIAQMAYWYVQSIFLKSLIN